ncbi:hypothetical protein JXJ21_07490 [candidate division KSB1 bacterium]|nr:hypothetical protein [candidate division KSB1 bacterium]
MTEAIIKLDQMGKEKVPAALRAQTYFDFSAHPFAHQAIFERTNSVCGAIPAIEDYTVEWLQNAIAERRTGVEIFHNNAPEASYTTGNFEILLEAETVFAPAHIIGSHAENACYSIYLEKGARIIGADIYLDKGSIYIGAETIIEPCVGIRGPAIVGKRNEIRQGAYLRGNCILGDACTLRGELKNVIMMNEGNFPHPSYLGDSICGYMTHFGNQATAANLGIYEGAKNSADRRTILLRCDNKVFDSGIRKMGVCMGDFCQVGCNAVSDPGTFLKPHTIVYSLTRISKGFYGPNEVLKNKPFEHGVIERAPLQSIN